MATRGYAVERPATGALFGQVMFLVALTCGTAALGAYVGRDLGGASWFVTWIAAFACFIGLNFAAARAPGLALALLFAAGFLLGLSVGATIDWFIQNNPSAVYQAAGATALTVGGLGTYGYATRRDLSYLYRGLFWALLALIAFGVVLIFVNIPGGSTIYALAGIAIFSGYTIVDFNRLRRAGRDEAIPLAAGIFLDIFNLFLLFLQLFGAGRD